jgi:hypothetical protein
MKISSNCQNGTLLLEFKVSTNSKNIPAFVIICSCKHAILGCTTIANKHMSANLENVHITKKNKQEMLNEKHTYLKFTQNTAIMCD